MKNLVLCSFVILLSSCSKNIDTAANEPSAPAAGPHVPASYFKAPGNSLPTTIPFENGKKLHVQVLDSVYYLEGDMAFSSAQIEGLKQLNSLNQRAFSTPFVRHWMGGFVPYKIDGLLSTDARNTILASIGDWQAASTLNFLPITSQNASVYPDYIEFRRSNVNNSYVGKQGGRQIINLAIFGSNENVSRSAATHEIGHAIGFYHEQSRADRNNFIRVTNNVRPAMIHNFQTYAEQGLPGADLGTFDFNSIMLYPSFISDPNFVFNTSLPALERLDGTTWWNNDWLSAGDVETADFIYGPPYARIEYVNVVNENNTTWCCSHERMEDDVYIRLYADEACTIPFTTPVDKNGQMVYRENINGSQWSQVYNFTIPAGAQSVLIAQSLVTRDYYDEYGNVTYQEQRSYGNQSAFMRW